jgi:serine/threonine protein kinase
MIELLGKMNPEFSTKGKYSQRYFNQNGKLIRIKEFNFKTIKERLVKKYKFYEGEAELIENFLLDMLQFEPKKRKTASELLKNKWLNSIDDEDDIDENKSNFLKFERNDDDIDSNESYNDSEDEIIDLVSHLKKLLENNENFDDELKSELKNLKEVIEKKIN